MNLMFSTCRSLQTGLILLALGACSKEPAPPQIAPLAPAATPAQESSANMREGEQPHHRSGNCCDVRRDIRARRTAAHRGAARRFAQRRVRVSRRAAAALLRQRIVERGAGRAPLRSAGRAGAGEVGQWHRAAGRNQRDSRARAVTAQSCARAKEQLTTITEESGYRAGSAISTRRPSGVLRACTLPP